MAQVHPRRHRESLAKQFVNFTSSTTGLDLTLRLIQALAQIAAEVCIDSATIKRCLVAKSQLALGRRYLRFFSVLDCFQNVYELLAGGSSPFDGGLLTTAELAESTFLGLYLLLENLTILHDMNIWLVPWYTPVLLEGNKFWFYAICISITSVIWQLVSGLGGQGRTPLRGEKEGSKDSASGLRPVQSTSSLVQRLVVEACDLTLPASFLGWMVLGDLEVGMAMAVSTVLASRDIWAKAQS